ncbi:hypothetical protein VTJ49DRAFT_2241 [Mycothermus thermophilus]|uniref:Uncharacterized protein n=1 Tax=Humicola insolens TaxID=85995 RepID=A0ABR3VC35_HUMIN
MATNDTPLTSPSSDVMESAIQTQMSLVSSFDSWLASKATAAPPGPLRDVVAKVQQRLDSYKRWLAAASKTPHSLPEEEVDDQSWDMEARTQADDGSVLVTGPGSGEPIRMSVEEKEAQDLMSDVGSMVQVCSSFAKAQTTLQALIQTVCETEKESSHLTQDPDATVKAYIRNLQDYNEMKDIGQQLISLVAENRDVPVITSHTSSGLIAAVTLAAPGAGPGSD